MGNGASVSHSHYGLLHTEIEGFDLLAELALDMRSSWNHASDEVWRQLDPDLWALTRNPWVVLQTASREKLQQVLANPAFRKNVEEQVQVWRDAVQKPAWFQQTHPKSKLGCVAYFSMEFMLSEALPIYSGGLGNVAGDQLKAASDLGVPVIGIGLLYQQGYFRQMIDKNGAQQALYPYNDPGQLPITPLRKNNGEWLRIKLDLPGHPIWLRTWQVKVGRVKLYLLDSNDVANYPPYRGITSELYGGGSDQRLMQELILGIGGWRLFSELGIKPDVCHLNEGHAALAVLERARSFMETTGHTFESALAVTRAGNLFTTHTAVAAGFDQFTPNQIEHCLGGYAQTQLGLTLNDLLALGRKNPDDTSEPFNMAYLAIRGSGAVNGVSRLHGEVSRDLFSSLFPRWPVNEVPVGYVTNGVHVPTWDSPAADKLWTEACGKDRWLKPTEALARDIYKISDTTLWKFRTTSSMALLDYARDRLSRQLAASGAPDEMIERAKQTCDCNTLTLGFARRFATYKRPDLLLNDPERLLRLLTNPHRPVQLVMAGKAHPKDQAGQALIQKWMRFIQRPEVRSHVIFLSDYDMHLAEQLVQGVDVWLNTPRRPWEASGTSGMKVLVNGGINLSELDGWWAEAYTPDVGWALGDGQEHNDDPAWDIAEAEALYELLENEVIPEFYTRNEAGIPSAWVARMRESMARLTPHYSTNRAVREYTEQYYLPAVSAYHKRSANKGAAGLQIIDWQHTLEQKWAALRFGEVKIETDEKQHTFEVQVYLNGLDPAAIRVELYADGENGNAPERVEMERVRQQIGANHGYIYRAKVSVIRTKKDYTARMLPSQEAVMIPLEDQHILWHE
ncbi:MAG: glycosyltransferase family 1 protein [Gammaproteobacteria bacterium]|nr:glycosyltransferase family 1 protein [Gammaproteobacteria bacterium]